ncbi:MAG: hypothetical protein OEQ47_10245 [Acidimicrobiia bacterium]|nr:hypothetical protein [Acidimicrobiia bacterium]
MKNVTRRALVLIKLLNADERGLNTAELLGNAALAIVALVAIWAGLQALGIDLIEAIGDLLTGEVEGAGG